MSACPGASCVHALPLRSLVLPFVLPLFNKLPIKKSSEGRWSLKPPGWPHLKASCLVQGLRKENRTPGAFRTSW